MATDDEYDVVFVVAAAAAANKVPILLARPLLPVLPANR